MWKYSHSSFDTRHFPNVARQIPQYKPPLSSTFHVMNTGSPEITLSGEERSLSAGPSGMARSIRTLELPLLYILPFVPQFCEALRKIRRQVM